MVDGHNVNYGLVASFRYLTETINKDLNQDAVQQSSAPQTPQHDSNSDDDSVSMDDFNRIISEISDDLVDENNGTQIQNGEDSTNTSPLTLKQEQHSDGSSSTSSPSDKASGGAHIDSPPEGSTKHLEEKMNCKPVVPVRKRKRRSSVDESVWEHHRVFFKLKP